MKKVLFIAAGLFLVLASVNTDSHATLLPIEGVKTDVELTSFSAISGLGINLFPLGTATVDASGKLPIISFPITGGTVNTDTGNALIEHQGSGFALANFKQLDVVLLGDFLIDTKKSTLFGDVAFINGLSSSGKVEDVPLFNLIPFDGLFEVNLTAAAAGLLADVFTIPNLTGFQIGLASVDLKVGADPVPEPGTIMLLGAGLVGLVGYSRRKFKTN